MSNSPAITLKEFCSKVDEERYLELGKSLASRNVGKSFSLLSFGLSLKSDKKEEYYKLYLKVVECWSNKLIELSRYEDVLKIFEVAHDIYPQSADLNYLLACTLYRLGKRREAWQYSLKVLRKCKNDPRAVDLVSSLTNSLVDRWHIPMINDLQRNAKFKEAIERNVQRGCTHVLDIGAGSALLSIYASRAGAPKVYACEDDEFMTELAADVLSLNSSSEKVTLINKHSKELHIPSDLPERLSLVITETFDAGLFGEHVLSSLKHAWENLLIPSTSNEEASQTLGKVIPCGADVWAAVCECDYIARQTKSIRKCREMFRGVVLKMDEPYLSEKLCNVPRKYKLLTEWQKVLSVDFNSISNIDELLQGKKEDFEFLITTTGRGDGIVLAFKLFLDPDTFIDTFPKSETCWENAVYPIFTSEILTKDSYLTVNMEFDDVLHFTSLPCNTPSLPPANISLQPDSKSSLSINTSSPLVKTSPPLVNTQSPSINIPSLANTSPPLVNTQPPSVNIPSPLANTAPPLVKTQPPPISIPSPLVSTSSVNTQPSASISIPLVNPPSFNLSTTNAQFIKCSNSSSFTNFYRELVDIYLDENELSALNVLDLCPFPEAGISLWERSGGVKLFLDNESTVNLLTETGVDVNYSKHVKGDLDVLFYWPFAPEGTLKENILSELQSYRKLLRRKDQIYPKFLHLEMVGIESDVIANMTRIEDCNTCSVDVAEVFNFLKTRHHLDLPIEGIFYKPITSVIHMMSIRIEDSKIFHAGNLEDTSTGFLIVGGDITRSSVHIRSISNGRLDGFVYWFELGNGPLSPDMETSSGSEQDCGEASFKMQSLKQELHTDEPPPIRKRSRRPIFSSCSRDSPINQCVLLLDEPINVDLNQSLSLQFATSEGRFSVAAETHEL